MDTLNKPYKILNQQPIEKDFFTLTIHEDFMGFEFLSYNEKEKKFILTDD